VQTGVQRGTAKGFASECCTWGAQSVEGSRVSKGYCNSFTATAPDPKRFVQDDSDSACSHLVVSNLFIHTLSQSVQLTDTSNDLAETVTDCTYTCTETTVIYCEIAVD